MNQLCRIRSGFTNQSDTIYTFITTNPPEEKKQRFHLQWSWTKPAPPGTGSISLRGAGREGDGAHPPSALGTEKQGARTPLPRGTVHFTLTSRSVRSPRAAGGEARPAGSRHRDPPGGREAAGAAPGEQGRLPRGRNQGRGGRHHLVSHPPPAAPASPGTKGGQRRLPRRRVGRGRQKTLAPTRGDEARHPQSDHPPPGAAGRRPPPPRLTSRRREAPQPRRNSRMLLRHSPSVRGSGYTCKRRGGRSARAAASNRAARLPPSAAPLLPAAPRTSCSLRRRRRRRSLPVRGLNREVNTEHRKWRARAGAPRPGAAPGSPASAAGRAASAGRGGRRREGREKRGSEGKGTEKRGREGKRGEGGAARPRPPRPAPGAAASPAGAGSRCPPVLAAQYFLTVLKHPCAIKGLRCRARRGGPWRPYEGQPGDGHSSPEPLQEVMVHRVKHPRRGWPVSFVGLPVPPLFWVFLLRFTLFF